MLGSSHVEAEAAVADLVPGARQGGKLMPGSAVHVQRLALSGKAPGDNGGAELGVVAVGLIPVAAVEVALGAPGNHSPCVADEYGVEAVAHEAVIVARRVSLRRWHRNERVASPSP